METENSPNLSNLTLDDVYAKVCELPNAGDKPEEQKKVTAFLMANRAFLEFLAKGIQDRMPPVLSAMVPRLLPIKKDDWWRIAPEAIWSLDENSWPTFFDLLTTMVHYAEN